MSLALEKTPPPRQVWRIVKRMDAALAMVCTKLPGSEIELAARSGPDGKNNNNNNQE